MSKQKEDVLLMIKHVRYKKVDGTLYVNSGRVAWRNQTSDTFRISAPFEDIRIQRVSPEQKEKVQLQLLMHNQESFTFQFSDSAGREKQLEMRNSVKELLQQLLPKFKDKAHSELKEKFRLLESNSNLLALYKELVVTGILSSEEFWARSEFPLKTNASTQSQKLTSSASSGSCVTSTSCDRGQLVGVPSYLLSDIKPEMDGVNSLKYNLTQETIDAIFRAYPTVRMKHRQLVPDKMSQADFWIKFFQSHYFHRDRTQVKQDDVFGDCVVQDERILLSELRKSRRLRHTVNVELDELEDNTAGTGYGVNLGPLPKSSSMENVSNASSGDSKLSTYQLLLRRFNMHSIMILRSLGSSSDSQIQQQLPSDSNHRHSLTYKDLAANGQLKEKLFPRELVEEERPRVVELHLDNTKDYFEGPSKSGDVVQGPGGVHVASQFRSTLNPNQAKQALLACRTSIKVARRSTACDLFSDYNAQLAIADVSAGGFLMGSGKQENSNPTKDAGSISGASDSRAPGESSVVRSNANHSVVLLSVDQSKELAQLYASAGELLRHFWSCFPVTSPQLAAKFDRISDSLQRFKTTKVFPFIESMGGGCGGVVDSVGSEVGDTGSKGSVVRGSATGRYRSRATAHLESMLECAEVKHREWLERRRR